MLLYAVALVAYLTHPLGEADTGEDMIKRSENMANAISWLRFLVLGTKWAVSMPWFVYTVGLPESSTRPRAAADRILFLERSDLLVMTGGRMSPHMRIEYQCACAIPIPVPDLTDMGEAPPWNTYDVSRCEIFRRAERAGL